MSIEAGLFRHQPLDFRIAASRSPTTSETTNILTFPTSEYERAIDPFPGTREILDVFDPHVTEFIAPALDDPYFKTQAAHMQEVYRSRGIGLSQLNGAIRGDLFERAASLDLERRRRNDIRIVQAPTLHSLFSDDQWKEYIDNYFVHEGRIHTKPDALILKPLPEKNQTLLYGGLEMTVLKGYTKQKRKQERFHEYAIVPRHLYGDPRHDAGWRKFVEETMLKPFPDIPQSLVANPLRYNWTFVKPSPNFDSPYPQPKEKDVLQAPIRLWEMHDIADVLARELAGFDDLTHGIHGPPKRSEGFERYAFAAD